MDSTEIIEKIRAEIERRKKELEKDKTIHPANQAGRIKELGLILSFLSDLEKEEKPMELDFEQALYKHFGQVKDFTLGMQIAKHFYELGKQSKPKVCEGLEEEISRYLREDCSDDDEPSISDVARHFAQWGAEHLDK